MFASLFFPFACESGHFVGGVWCVLEVFVGVGWDDSSVVVGVGKGKGRERVECLEGEDGRRETEHKE